MKKIITLAIFLIHWLAHAGSIFIATQNGVGTNTFFSGPVTNLNNDFIVRSNNSVRFDTLGGATSAEMYYDIDHASGSDPQGVINVFGSLALATGLNVSANARSHIGATQKTLETWVVQREGDSTSGVTNTLNHAWAWSGSYWNGSSSVTVDFGPVLHAGDTTGTNWNFEWRMLTYNTSIARDGSATGDKQHTNFMVWDQFGILFTNGTAAHPNIRDMASPTSGYYISGNGDWGVSAAAADVFGGNALVAGIGSARGTGHSLVNTKNFDIAQGANFGFIFGAQSGAETRGANTAKVFKIGGAPYNTAAAPNTFLSYYTDSGETDLDFGGQTAIGSAATHIGFWTAASVGTASGTEGLRLDSSGVVSVLRGTIVAATNTAAMNTVTNDLVVGTINVGRNQRFSVAVTCYTNATLTVAALGSLVYSNATTGRITTESFGIAAGVLAVFAATNQLVLPDCEPNSRFWVTNCGVVANSTIVTYK